MSRALQGRRDPIGFVVPLEAEKDLRQDWSDDGRSIFFQKLCHGGLVRRCFSREERDPNASINQHQAGHGEHPFPGSRAAASYPASRPDRLVASVSFASRNVCTLEPPCPAQAKGRSPSSG